MFSATRPTTTNVNASIGFDLIFSREDLQAALFVSLLTACLIVVLLLFLNRYARRRYFTIWTVAWVFYALWLLFNFRLPEYAVDAVPFVLKQCCIGIAAVFLLWGSAEFLKARVKARVLGLFLVFLLVWSCMGAYHLDNPLAFQIPLFSLIGATSLLASWCYFCARGRAGAAGAGAGAGMLGLGFLLWGGHLIAFPFFTAAEQLSAVFLISTVLHLLIAIGMIVLVLDEEIAAARRAWATADEQASETRVFRRKARSAEARFRHLFEHASEAIVVASAADFSILELNRKARDLLGVQDLGIDRVRLGQFLDIDPPDPPPVTGSEWLALLEGRESVSVRRRDGRKTPVIVEGSEIRFDDLAAFQLFFHDHTEKTRLERQLRQAEKLSALGQMISGVAHELNNPLTTVRGYLELILARRELPDRTRGDLEKVATETERAAKLVTQFLHFARERKARREPADLNEIVRAVADMREFEFRLASISLELDLADDLPRALADVDQIQQVLLNLITNALHAMVGSPPPLTMTVRTRDEGDWILVEVEDEGPGVPEELVSQIFEPFFTTKAVGTGTGLGLSLAHSVMTDHQGRIECRAASSGGAVFSLWFPVGLEGGADDTTIILPAPESLEPSRSAREAEILVLDDEKAIAEMLGEMIGILGHRPTLCNAPREALQFLRERDFDVILSDFRMPDMNGEDFHAEVGKLKPLLARRIVFISGDVANEKTQDFLRSTGNLKIDKPFKIDSLREAIDGVLAFGD